LLLTRTAQDDVLFTSPHLGYFIVDAVTNKVKRKCAMDTVSIRVIICEEASAWAFRHRRGCPLRLRVKR